MVSSRNFSIASNLVPENVTSSSHHQRRQVRNTGWATSVCFINRCKSGVQSQLYSEIVFVYKIGARTAILSSLRKIKCSSTSKGRVRTSALQRRLWRPAWKCKERTKEAFCSPEFASLFSPQFDNLGFWPIQPEQAVAVARLTWPQRQQDLSTCFMSEKLLLSSKLVSQL